VLDIAAELQAIRRQASTRPGAPDGGDLLVVTVTRDYQAEQADVWEALTDRDRLRRWVGEVTGDLEVGGTFQLADHAGGTILGCEPPRRVRFTFGGEDSIITVTLSPAGADRTTLTLEHAVPASLLGGNQVAIEIGRRWDDAAMVLARHLAGEAVESPIAPDRSDDARSFARASIEAWRATTEAAALAPAEDLADQAAVLTDRV
jgi:uncharacterized protein YndB with AHSA1/START domain